MKTRSISLCAVPYVVTEQDGQVIFEERSGFYGLHSRFGFEWMGCGWYLVDTEDTFGRVFVGFPFYGVDSADFEQVGEKE